MWLLLLVGLWVAAGHPLPDIPDIGGSAPVKTDKLSVLIIEETADRGTYTSDQQFAITATDANSVQAAVTKRTGQFFALDKDQTDLSRMPSWVREAFALPRTGLPWIVASGPKSGKSVALPKTNAEILAVVEAAK